MPRRRYAGYIVLWDGVPCAFANGRLFRGCIVPSGQNMTKVTQGCHVIRSIEAVRRAIQATREEMYEAGRVVGLHQFFVARVYA